MESAKPVKAAERRSPQRFAEGFAARLLRARFVQAGRNPGVASPAVVKAFEALQIPSPLHNRAVVQENADETKRIHAGEWKLPDGCIRDSAGISHERGLHDLASADGVARNAG